MTERDRDIVSHLQTAGRACRGTVGDAVPGLGVSSVEATGNVVASMEHTPYDMYRIGGFLAALRRGMQGRRDPQPGGGEYAIGERGLR